MYAKLWTQYWCDQETFLDSGANKMYLYMCISQTMYKTFKMYWSVRCDPLEFFVLLYFTVHPILRIPDFFFILDPPLKI